MKAERRQELRTNELAQMIEDSREFFRVWGSYILGGAVVIALIVAFTVYRSKAAGEQLAESWNSLQTLSFFDAKGERKSEEEIKQNFARLEALAAEDRGADFLLEVLSNQAQVAMRLAASGEAGLDPGWLERARNAYESMRQRLPENPLAVAMALNGLANVEADSFVVDGDPSRKGKALEHLQKLRDDPRFSATPFQKSALDRINKLDQVFKRVDFVSAPPPTTQPVTIESLTPISPSGELPLAPPSPVPAPESDNGSSQAPAPESPSPSEPGPDSTPPAPPESETPMPVEPAPESPPSPSEPPAEPEAAGADAPAPER